MTPLESSCSIQFGSDCGDRPERFEPTARAVVMGRIDGVGVDSVGGEGWGC